MFNRSLQLKVLLIAAFLLALAGPVSASEVIGTLSSDGSSSGSNSAPQNPSPTENQNAAPNQEISGQVSPSSASTSSTSSNTSAGSSKGKVLGASTYEDASARETNSSAPASNAYATNAQLIGGNGSTDTEYVPLDAMSENIPLETSATSSSIDAPISWASWLSIILFTILFIGTLGYLYTRPIDDWQRV